MNKVTTSHLMYTIITGALICVFLHPHLEGLITVVQFVIVGLGLVLACSLALDVKTQADDTNYLVTKTPSFYCRLCVLIISLLSAYQGWYIIATIFTVGAMIGILKNDEIRKARYEK